MMTPDQACAILGTLMVNVDWSTLNFQALQENVIKNAKEAGRQFTTFLKMGAKMLPNPPESCQTSTQAMECIYDAIGLGDQYCQASKKFDLAEVSGFWKVLMVNGLTYAKIVEAYGHFGVKLGTFGVDLSTAIQLKEEQRDPNRDGTYAIKFRQNVEADPDNANQSYRDRRSAKCQDITALERLLLGLVVFLVTRQHLDLETWTLTSSLGVGGDVVVVSFDPSNGEAYVFCWDQGSAYPDVRARSAELSSS